MALDWQPDRTRCVIFDVDGTLYDAARLRRRMIVELLAYCLADPRRLTALRTLQTYRRERERLAEAESTGIITLQYERPARRLGLSPRVVEATIGPWIHERPLRHLARMRIRGIRRFIDRLRASGRSVAVLSDYPADKKLAALGLTVDRVVAATDPEVDRLKPHPAGLEILIAAMGTDPASCLLIGDRDERDGAVARRLHVPYLLRTRRVTDPRREFSDYLRLLEEID